MINVLIPLGGKSPFFDEAEYRFPRPLIEINGISMIELVIRNLERIPEPKKFIFVVNAEDCQKFHLDQVLRLLTDGHCEIVRLNGPTRGAACSALMAIEHINTSDSLIISNGDQIIDTELDLIIDQFETAGYDAGVLCFDTVHPRWSFVRLDEKGQIIETAEKRPISRHAIAGFYYFKQGADFVRAAMKMIEKDAEVDGLYYIAPSINELVLENKKLGIHQIDNDSYYTFYSPQKIKEYEKRGV